MDATVTIFICIITGWDLEQQQQLQQQQWKWKSWDKVTIWVRTQLPCMGYYIFCRFIL